MTHNVRHVTTTTETHTYTDHGNGNPMTNISMADIADIVHGSNVTANQPPAVIDQRLVQIAKSKRFTQDGSTWVLNPTPNYEMWITLIAAVVVACIPVVLAIVMDTLYPLVILIIPVILFLNVPKKFGNYTMVFDDAAQTVYYKGRGFSCLAKEVTVPYSDCIRVNATLRVVQGHRNGWSRSYYVYVLATVADNLKFMSKEDNLELDAMNAFVAERLSLVHNNTHQNEGVKQHGPRNPVVDAFISNSSQ